MVTLPFARYQELLAGYDRLQDLKATLHIFRSAPYRSVTRQLVLIDVATAFGFFALAAYSIGTHIWS